LTERALQIREVVNGPTHPEYGILLIDYGDLLRLLGRHQEAGTKLEEASVVLANSVGTQHPEYARCLLVMGELHVNNGEPAAAAVPVIEAASIALEVLKSGAIVQSERQQQLSFEKYQPFLSAILSLSLNFRDTAETTPDHVLEEVWKWKSLVLRRLYASRLTGNDEQFLNLTKELQQVTRRLARIVQSEPSSSDITRTDANAPTESDEHARWRARFEECQLLREALEARLSAASAEFRAIQQPLTTGEVQASLSDDAVLLEFIVYDDVFNESGTTELRMPHRNLAVGIVRKSRDPVFVELGPVEPISTATKEFLNPLLAHLSADSESEARALVAARDLRQLLWEPVEPHLDGIATVVLSVDSFLGRLPFNAIPGRQAGTYLIEDFEIVTVPYAQFLRPQAGDAHDLKRKSGLLVVGGVEYGSPSSEQSDLTPALEGQIRGRQQSAPDGKWITLPGTKKEIDAIAELYGQQFGRESSVHILTGSAATSENFTRLAPQYRTLHLATHAYFGQPFAPETPPSQLLAESTPTLLSGIVFAGANSDSEGILYAGDVQAMDLQGTDLTVLSGCETSQGVTAAGAGVIGLQRAFHLAGVRTVVGSLWRVDDRATQRLMERFYRNLWMSRMEKGEALRDAQLWLLNNPEVLLETPATRGPRAVSSSISGPPKKLSPLPPADSSAAGSRPDPFYWAAFQLSGDWQ